MAPPFGARGNATWAIHRRRALASGCAVAFQKCDRQHVEAIGMFVLRPMSAFVEDLELRPRDILMHRRRLGHRSEEHTSETPVTNAHLVCRLLLEKKKTRESDTNNSVNQNKHTTADTQH